jgi:RNA polymerase sigma-70 factor (ECF subfamily)
MDLDIETTIYVRRAREGHGASLAWLVERFTPALLVQARYRLGRHLREHYDAEDLVQDTWVIALPRLPELSPRDGRVTPTLLRFLSQTLLQRYGTLIQKHILGKPLRAAAPAGEGTAGAGGPLAYLASEQTGVVKSAMRSEAIERVREALTQLSAEDQEVIVLRSLEQLSLQTAAQLLHVSEGTLAVRHHRALKRLRLLLPESTLDFSDDR